MAVVVLCARALPPHTPLLSFRSIGNSFSRFSCSSRKFLRPSLAIIDLMQLLTQARDTLALPPVSFGPCTLRALVVALLWPGVRVRPRSSSCVHPESRFCPPSRASHRTRAPACFSAGHFRARLAVPAAAAPDRKGGAPAEQKGSQHHGPLPPRARGQEAGRLSTLPSLPLSARCMCPLPCLRGCRQPLSSCSSRLQIPTHPCVRVITSSLLRACCLCGWARRRCCRTCPRTSGAT